MLLLLGGLLVSQVAMDAVQYTLVSRWASGKPRRALLAGMMTETLPRGLEGGETVVPFEPLVDLPAAQQAPGIPTITQTAPGGSTDPATGLSDQPPQYDQGIAPIPPGMGWLPSVSGTSVPQQMPFGVGPGMGGHGTPVGGMPQSYPVANSPIGLSQPPAQEVRVSCQPDGSARYLPGLDGRLASLESRVSQLESGTAGSVIRDSRSPQMCVIYVVHVNAAESGAQATRASSVLY